MTGFQITAILPPLLYLGYLTIHVGETREPIHVPYNREFLMYGNLPVLS